MDGWVVRSYHGSRYSSRKEAILGWSTNGLGCRYLPVHGTSAPQLGDADLETTLLGQARRGLCLIRVTATMTVLVVVVAAVLLSAAEHGHAQSHQRRQGLHLGGRRYGRTDARERHRLRNEQGAKWIGFTLLVPRQFKTTPWTVWR